ncbi:MAG: transketolase family protein [Gammaproteobacteria bacterium]
MKPLDPKSWNIQTTMGNTSLVMGEELAALADTRDDLLVMTADLMTSNGLDVFHARHPEKFVNTGIAEQNMISVAAGLAANGFRVYVSTFASFASLLGAEQMRTDLAYTRMPVRVLAHHAGISMGFYGTSHHAVEDLAVTRAMAGMTVMAPCDANAIRAALRATVDLDGPVYLRLGRGREATVYDGVPVLEPGRFQRLRDGGDIALIATGIGVAAALGAADALGAEGIRARVLDAIYIKPIDADAILAAARETGRILTVEEHNPNGGLGGAVAEVIAEADVAVRFRRFSLPDEYALVAPPSHLYRHYGLTAAGVAAAARRLLDA